MKAPVVVLLSLTAACAVTPPAPTSDHGLTVGHVARLHSAVLGEERELLVALPEDYASSRERYPVLWLLDGDNDFVHTAGVVSFLSGIDRIPPLLLVGVVNTNRSRDLTPPSTDEEETAFWDGTGGAEDFQRFLREEALPFVDARYRTQPYRVLHGLSFGGLFALFDYLSADPVFDAVVAGSPSIGWNRGHYLDLVPAVFADGAPRPLYVASAGKDYPGSLADVRAFVERVDASGAAPEDWRHEHFAGEGHYSVHHLSSYHGLGFLFAAWPVPDDVAASADFDAYAEHFAALSERFGYEVPVPLHSIVRVGNQLLREQRFDDGIAIFERALAVHPEVAEAHWRVGEAYWLAGRYDEARPHFARAHALAVAQGLPDLTDYVEALEREDGTGQ